MTDAQVNKFLYEECETFNEKHTLDDYKEMICKYLMLCSWKYTKESAEERVKLYSDAISEAYAKKETVGDIALDIGYCCG